MNNSTRKEDRTRNWTFVVYPESAVDNWRDNLINLHIKFAVSPLHDKDVNPNGTPKKSHYHVVLVFDNVKSYKQVLNIRNSCIYDEDTTDIDDIEDGKLNMKVQRVESISGMIRYLTHMDNPEKYQYNQEDVKTYGGLDIADYLVPTLFTQDEILGQVIDFVTKNRITHLFILLKYAKKYHRSDWYHLILNQKTYVIVQLMKDIKECSYVFKDGNYVFTDTGETLDIDSYEE